MTIKSIPKVILLADTSRVSGRKLLRGVAKYARFHGPWAFNRKPMFYAGLRNGVVMLLSPTMSTMQDNSTKYCPWACLWL